MYVLMKPPLQCQMTQHTKRVRHSILQDLLSSNIFILNHEQTAYESTQAYVYAQHVQMRDVQ